MKKKIYFFTGLNCAACEVAKIDLGNYLQNKEIDIQIEYINISENEDNARFAAKFNIMSVPTLIYLEDEKPVHSYIGSSAVVNMIDEGII